MTLISPSGIFAALAAILACAPLARADYSHACGERLNQLTARRYVTVNATMLPSLVERVKSHHEEVRGPWPRGVLFHPTQLYTADQDVVGFRVVYDVGEARYFYFFGTNSELIFAHSSLPQRANYWVCEGI